MDEKTLQAAVLDGVAWALESALHGMQKPDGLHQAVGEVDRALRTFLSNLKTRRAVLQGTELAPDGRLCGHGVEPTHRCKVCGATWRLNPEKPESWTLMGATPSGQCCNNVEMRDQIEPLQTQAGQLAHRVLQLLDEPDRIAEERSLRRAREELIDAIWKAFGWDPEAHQHRAGILPALKTHLEEVAQLRRSTKETEKAGEEIRRKNADLIAELQDARCRNVSLEERNREDARATEAYAAELVGERDRRKDVEGLIGRIAVAAGLQETAGPAITCIQVGKIKSRLDAAQAALERNAQGGKQS